MSRSIVVSLLAALVWCLALSSTRGEVVTLTQGNFYSTIQQDPTKSWFVKWYAEWCGKCLVFIFQLREFSVVLAVGAAQGCPALAQQLWFVLQD